MENTFRFCLLSFPKTKPTATTIARAKKNFAQVTSRHFGSFVIISGSFEFELGLYERWTKYTQHFTRMKNAKATKINNNKQTNERTNKRRQDRATAARQHPLRLMIMMMSLIMGNNKIQFHCTMEYNEMYFMAFNRFTFAQQWTNIP